MDKKMIDLHVHSTASDGVDTPTVLLEKAKEAGLCALALTDHDTVDGIEEAALAAEKLGIELIPGVELSTEYEGQEVHVVGLYIDTTNEPLVKSMAEFRDARDNRNVYMMERLQAEGFSITLEAIAEMFPDAVITRAHVARYLLETKQIPDIKTAFSEYIGDGCRCYVDRPKVSPMDAVKLIKDAGGIAILAHPVLYKKITKEQIGEMIDQMIAVGLDGMEALYSENQYEDEQEYRMLAREKGLLVSGGSDYHGANKPHIKLGIGRGKLFVPYSVLEDIKAKKEKI